MNQEGTVSYKVFFVVVVFLALMYSLGSEFSEVYQCDIYVPQEGRGEVGRKRLKPLLTLMFTSSLEAKGKSVHLQ